MTNQKKKREKFDKKESAVPLDVLAEEFGNEFAEATTSKQVNNSEDKARQRLNNNK